MLIWFLAILAVFVLVLVFRILCNRYSEKLLEGKSTSALLLHFMQLMQAGDCQITYNRLEVRDFSRLEVIDISNEAPTRFRIVVHFLLGNIVSFGIQKLTPKWEVAGGGNFEMLPGNRDLFVLTKVDDISGLPLLPVKRYLVEKLCREAFARVRQLATVPEGFRPRPSGLQAILRGWRMLVRLV